MTRTRSLFAVLGCSLALTSSSALVSADDKLAGAAEKSEVSTAAPASTTTATTATPASAPVLLWPSTLTPVRKSKEKGIPNFGKLNDFIWRSGQPSGEGYARLKELGVKTIVSLRKEDDEKDRIPNGIKYVYIPISDERAPTTEQAQQFLEVASNPDNWPLLVHCHGGEGRAGVMAALVRYAFDGWESDKIMKEVDNFRVAHLGFIKTKMCGPQRDFLKEWAAAHKAGEYASKISKPTDVASNK